jgi:hypothetical protein
MKILINTCFGGFNFSEEFQEEFELRFNLKISDFDHDNIRTNPEIIELFLEFGPERSSGKFSDLKLIEIPDDVEYEISEYDGIEHVAEKHRTWR